MTEPDGTPGPRTAVPERAAEGLLVLDKPSGMTSHDVVARVRRLAGTRRVGHAGTLDPMATGVLVLGLGRATRLLGHLSLTDKEYLARIRLGSSTSTGDAQGEVQRRGSTAGLEPRDIEAAMAALTGPLLQVPPSVSAIKVDGRRAYARVRAGEDVVLAPRPVTVHAFELTGRDGDELVTRIACSTGTYVRALARDLGEALGCGGHLAALHRTRVGPFDSPAALEAPLPVIGLADALGRLFAVRRLEEQEAIDVRHGRPVAATGGPGMVAAFAGDEPLALIEDRDGMARPRVVLLPA